jgi:hypothetical protein
MISADSGFSQWAAWHGATPEQMLRYIFDLRSQLTLTAALLHDRNEAIGGAPATEFSRRAVAEAEALLRRKPGEAA